MALTVMSFLSCRFSGADLVNRATTTFGYLNHGKGYCRRDGKCKAFPIIIGAACTALMQSMLQTPVLCLLDFGSPLATCEVHHYYESCLHLLTSMHKLWCGTAGETGSALSNPQDTQFYDTFIPYLQNTGVGRDGKHNAIPHVFWWAWNANSGDTGGLVDNTWLQVCLAPAAQHVASISSALQRLHMWCKAHLRPAFIVVPGHSSADST